MTIIPTLPPRRSVDINVFVIDNVNVNVNVGVRKDAPMDLPQLPRPIMREPTRQRLGMLRSVLGHLLKHAQPVSFSPVPVGKRIQTRRDA